MAQWPPLMRGHPFWEATFTQHLGWLLVRGFTVVKKVWRTDGRTDRRTDWTIHGAAWSQLKNTPKIQNYANLRDLIAVTSLVILLKLDSNHWFFSLCDIQFDGCPQTRQIWGIWKLRLAYSPETPNLGQNRWCFAPCDLEIWWMTLENNRASLLCCMKLCATLHSHRWIQTRVTVQKRPIWVKFDNF